jgi:succinoglycan exporter
MAVAVRFLLERFGAELPGAAIQVLAGSIAGALIYAVLFGLTERALLRKLLRLLRERRAASMGLG